MASVNKIIKSILNVNNVIIDSASVDLNERNEKVLKVHLHPQKKKVTKKHFSPDIAAVKVLLERYYKTYEEKILSMSDEDLEEERDKLQQLLKGETNGD